MVTFFDPIEEKEISYHIDKKLRLKWEKLREGKLSKKDEDRCYLIDGRERSGKSVFALQQAKYIDPSFDLSRVCFTPDSFLEQIRNAKPGQVVVFDEAFRGLSSKGAQSKVNKKIIQALMEVGQRNLIIFIVLPTFFLLEMYAAVLRSNALFHIYKDKRGGRAFRIYNYNKKSLLYNTGKKKGFSYSFPKVKHTGRFFNIYSIDEKKYRKKKGDSFGEEIEQEPEEHKWIKQRNAYIYLCKKVYRKTYKRQCDDLLSVGVDLGKSLLAEMGRKVERELKSREKAKNDEKKVL